MTVFTPTRDEPFTKMVDENFSKLARSLIGGHLPTIAKHALADKCLREHIFTKVVETIDFECDRLCQRDNPSLFRKIGIPQLSVFKWEMCIEQLKQKAPTLLTLVKALVSKSDHRNQQKKDERHYPGMCMAIAVLLKERNREMVGVQTLLSLVLFTSRVQKQVNQ